MKRRVVIRLDENIVVTLSKLRQRYHITTLNRLITVLLERCLADAPAPPQEDESEDEIGDMFREFADWKQQPDGTVPTRHFHKDIDNG